MTRIDMPFDTVQLKSGDAFTDISVEAFFAMPLQERVGHILSGTLRFLRAGERVDQSVALTALRARSKQRS